VNSKPEKKGKERGVFLPALLFGLAMGAMLFSYNISKPIEFPEFGDSGHFSNAFWSGFSGSIIYGGVYSLITWLKRSFFNKSKPVKVLSSQSGFTSLIVFTFSLVLYILVRIIPFDTFTNGSISIIPTKGSTASVENCFISVKGQPYQLSFTGEGAFSVCSKILERNDSSFSTIGPIVGSIICSYKKNDITANVRDVNPQSKSSNALCSILNGIDDFEEMSPSENKALIDTDPFDAITGNCMEWSEINLANVGETLCIYGTARNSWYSENQAAHIIIFSGDPKSLYLIMYGNWTFDGINDKCVSVTGKVERVYDTPVIRIPEGDPVFICD